MDNIVTITGVIHGVSVGREICVKQGKTFYHFDSTELDIDYYGYVMQMSKYEVPLEFVGVPDYDKTLYNVGIWDTIHYLKLVEIR